MLAMLPKGRQELGTAWVVSCTVQQLACFNLSFQFTCQAVETNALNLCDTTAFHPSALLWKTLHMWRPQQFRVQHPETCISFQISHVSSQLLQLCFHVTVPAIWNKRLGPGAKPSHHSTSWSARDLQCLTCGQCQRH